VGKNVAVFVDVANIFYAAKAAGVDIDYVTLLKSATAGRDFVRAYAYTGLDPDNENQRNFHQFLARHSYKVVSKDIRKYGDGKVKANLDIELVVDLMKTARNLDIAVIVSGDGDFASAIRAVQEMGVRCEVISFRGNTSSDLIDVADLFTDITQIAKVDKGSTRSGRRVADDEEDLSMTEVPEKQSEGTGRGRGRGRRGRTERDEAPAATRGSDRGATGRGTAAARSTAARSTAAARGAAAGLVALPGEKLSRAVAAASADATSADATDELAEAAPVAVEEPGPEDLEGVELGEGAQVDADGRRRRRRRGGRGRGRGHRDEAAGPDEGLEPVTGETVEAEAPPEAREPERPRRGRSGELPTPFDDLEALEAAPRAPRPTPFGSVWDRQLGTPPAPRTAAELPPLPEDDEDLDEPEIPEYLIAEQRQGQRRGGRGGRGGGSRSAYAAAIDRERYGGGRGASVSRYAEPNRRTGGVARSTGPATRGPRSDRPERFDRPPRTSGGDPWSEVPPELEELLLAQLAQGAPAPAAAPEAIDRASTAEAAASEAGAPRRGTTRRTSTRGTTRKAAADKAAGTMASAPVGEAPTEPAETVAPKRRTTRRTTARAAAAPEDPAPAEPVAAEAAETAAPKRRTTRRAPARATTTVEVTPEVAAAAAEVQETPAPKRRTTRRRTAAADTVEG
jgi:uncharacterized LabA/DUF88 family protein